MQIIKKLTLRINNYHTLEEDQNSINPSSKITNRWSFQLISVIYKKRSQKIEDPIFFLSDNPFHFELIFGL